MSRKPHQPAFPRSYTHPKTDSQESPPQPQPPTSAQTYPPSYPTTSPQIYIPTSPQTSQQTYPSRSPQTYPTSPQTSQLAYLPTSPRTSLPTSPQISQGGCQNRKTQSEINFHRRKLVERDPISRIKAVKKELDELKLRVEKFAGKLKDKEYLYLDEMLTRSLLKLDAIETKGRDDVRRARKDLIRDIQNCISTLESRVPNGDKDVQDNEEEVKRSEEDLPHKTTANEKPKTGDDA